VLCGRNTTCLFGDFRIADACLDRRSTQAPEVAVSTGGQWRHIEVPAEQVHETRLTLMSAGVPALGGGRIPRYFDKSELGSYGPVAARVLPAGAAGELARTIGALEDVKQARVHLVLPDSTLFKRIGRKRALRYL